MQYTPQWTECMSLPDIQQATFCDDHLHFKEHIMQGWPLSRNAIPEELKLYWTSKEHLAIIDGMLMKERHSIFPKELQKQALEKTAQQPHRYINEAASRDLYMLDKKEYRHWKCCKIVLTRLDNSKYSQKRE